MSEPSAPRSLLVARPNPWIAAAFFGRGLGVRSCMLGIAVGLLLTTGSSLKAAEETDVSIDQVSPDSTISREAWRKKVEQARERAERARQEAASRPREAPPARPSAAQVATERVLNDETLQTGDIVATDKGLFVLRGRSDDGGLILQPLPRQR